MLEKLFRLGGFVESAKRVGLVGENEAFDELAFGGEVGLATHLLGFLRKDLWQTDYMPVPGGHAYPCTESTSFSTPL